ncbi:DUF3618 domain-containing protein [Actinoplanes sp. NPDC049668]|uniref:DUF3618 domain-containing protein n=1 Tax=unclassified Actinoplanes TaxID=2626549 RepID=UPI0033B92530
MAQEPDRIREEIEGTRAELTRDVDRLADKTSPRRVAKRRWSAVKEKVMGTPGYGGSGGATGTVKDKAAQLGDKASRLGDQAGDAAHGAVDSMKAAPHQVAQQTQGNPIAAGVIAFGIGLLAASLIPPTELEKHAGQQIKENSGDLTDKVRETAMEMKDDLSGPVQDAVGQVKETARDAAATTRDEAKSSAQDAAGEARHAARQAT